MRTDERLDALNVLLSKVVLELSHMQERFYHLCSEDIDEADIVVGEAQEGGNDGSDNRSVVDQPVGTEPDTGGTGEPQVTLTDGERLNWLEGRIGEGGVYPHWRIGETRIDVHMERLDGFKPSLRAAIDAAMSAHLQNAEQDVLCPKCRGGGLGTDGETACSVCHGTGEQDTAEGQYCAELRQLLANEKAYIATLRRELNEAQGAAQSANQQLYIALREKQALVQDMASQDNDFRTQLKLARDKRDEAREALRKAEKGAEMTPTRAEAIAGSQHMAQELALVQIELDNQKSRADALEADNAVLASVLEEVLRRFRYSNETASYRSSEPGYRYSSLMGILKSDHPGAALLKRLEEAEAAELDTTKTLDSARDEIARLKERVEELAVDRDRRVAMLKDANAAAATNWQMLCNALPADPVKLDPQDVAYATETYMDEYPQSEATHRIRASQDGGQDDAEG